MATELPNINAVLRIHPEHIEKDFWRSDTYRRWAHMVDAWNSIITIALNVLFVRAMNASLPQFYGLQAAMRPLLCIYILIAVAQLCWMTAAEQQYYRWRTSIAYANSFLRVVAFSWASRRWAAALNNIDPPPPHYNCGADRAHGVRALLWWSSAAIAFLHTCTNPLPFFSQVAVHLAYLAAMLLVRLQPGVALIQRTDCTAVMQDLCYAIEMLAYSTQTSVLGAPATFQSEICDTHGVAAMTIYTTVFVGFLVPVYVAYRLERHMKAIFVNGLLFEVAQLSHEASEEVRLLLLPTVGFPHVLDCAALCWMGYVLWLVVTRFLPSWQILLRV